MGTSVEAPKPTAEERRLQSEQAALLRQQRDILLEQGRLQELLLPIFGAQSGIQFEFDDEGNIVGATSTRDPEEQFNLFMEQLGYQREQIAAQRELFPFQRQIMQQQLQDLLADDASGLRETQRQVELGLAERSLKALRGELPVDPTLERELVLQERTLRDTLQQQLGPGYETSTPGIEALQKFGEGAASLRSAAQTGQLSLAEQLGLARTQVRQAERLQGIASLRELGLGQGSNISQLAALPGAQIGTQQAAIFGPAYQLAGGLGQTAGGFGVAQVPYQQQRAMEFQANMFNAQNSGIGAIGSIFGSVLGALPFSDARLKKYLGIPVAYIDDIPVYWFEYAWGEEGFGVMAQDVPGASEERDGFLVVDYQRIVEHA